MFMTAKIITLFRNISNLYIDSHFLCVKGSIEYLVSILTVVCLYSVKWHYWKALGERKTFKMEFPIGSVTLTLIFLLKGFTSTCLTQESYLCTAAILGSQSVEHKIDIKPKSIITEMFSPSLEEKQMNKTSWSQNCLKFWPSQAGNLCVIYCLGMLFTNEKKYEFTLGKLLFMLERLQDHLKNMYTLFIDFPSACVGYVQFIMYH